MRKMIAKISEANKNKTVIHIESTIPKERFAIDIAYLSDFVSTTHRYLIILVDHFSEYGWEK